eukprot:3563114-Amphidinium_carterae.1
MRPLRTTVHPCHIMTAWNAASALKNQNCSPGEFGTSKHQHCHNVTSLSSGLLQNEKAVCNP